MIKNKNITDIKKEKILSKCIALISAGYSFEYCEAKFKRYGNILDEYFPIISGLKKLRRDDLSEAFLKRTLNKIYDNHDLQNNYIENSNNTKNKTIGFYSILKPAIIFLAAILFFSFSFMGILSASQKSLPGNPLYPVKRYGENMRLLITPESKKSILHYQFLENRLNEATMLFISDDKEQNIINSTIMDAEKEFDKCKKYNYFGNYTQKEIEDFIEIMKEKSLKEYNTGNTQESDLSKKTPNTYDTLENNDSGSNWDYEKDMEEKDEVESSDLQKDADISEIEDEAQSDAYKETENELEIEDSQETEDGSLTESNTESNDSFIEDDDKYADNESEAVNSEEKDESSTSEEENETD